MLGYVCFNIWLICLALLKCVFIILAFFWTVREGKHDRSEIEICIVEVMAHLRRRTLGGDNASLVAICRSLPSASEENLCQAKNVGVLDVYVVASLTCFVLKLSGTL